MKHRRIALAISTLAVAGLLGACGVTNAGDAAVVGPDRVTDAQLASVVQETLVAQGQPKDAPADQLTGQVLQRMVTMRLVDQFAAQQGVTASQGEIDGFLRQYEAQAGGRQGVEEAFLQQNVAPSMLESLLRLNILVAKLGQKLAPAADQNGQQQAVFDALTQFSAQEDTSIAARYGTWTPDQLAIGPVPDDLSIPRQG